MKLSFISVISQLSLYVIKPSASITQAVKTRKYSFVAKDDGTVAQLEIKWLAGSSE